MPEVQESFHSAFFVGAGICDRLPAIILTPPPARLDYFFDNRYNGGYVSGPDRLS